MRKVDNICVRANFDSGNFIGTFSVNKYSPNSYNNFDSCIQGQFNLSFDDFKILELQILELQIAAVIYSYIRLKEK
jgi:hypothetical protein